jgi:hypothetical protein
MVQDYSLRSVRATDFLLQVDASDNGAFSNKLSVHAIEASRSAARTVRLNRQRWLNALATRHTVER